MTDKRPGAVDFLVGTRLRRRRVALGISQMALAEHLGVTFQQVQKYENGTNRISASRLQTAASMLAVPVMHFFEQDGDAPVIAGGLTSFSPPLRQSHREAVKLTKYFVGIRDRALRGAVIAMVEAAADVQAAACKGPAGLAAPLQAPPPRSGAPSSDISGGDDA